MSGPAKTQEEYGSLVECFPTVGCINGNWPSLLCDYYETREKLLSAEPSEIPELTSEHTIFAKSMRWVERLVLGYLEKMQPSPGVMIATPKAALHWMIEVTRFLILLALFESHTTYLIMLRAATANSNGGGQRWLTYAHKLNSNSRAIPRYTSEHSLSSDIFQFDCDSLHGDEYDLGLVDLWWEQIPLSEGIALLGDEMHALHKMVQNIKDAKSPADVPDVWDARMTEIFDKIDSLPKW